MSNPISRLLRRFAMPTILRNVGRANWGFYSNEEDRMHLQTVADRREDYKAWLEDGGRRVVEDAYGNMPAAVLRALREDLAREPERRHVERAWLQRLITMGKVTTTIDSTNGIALVDTYAGTRSAIRRRINLRRHTADSIDYAPGNWRLDGDLSALVLGTQLTEDRQIYVYLPDVIWGDVGG